MTGCEFEYGTSPSYGTSVPCTPKPPASGLPRNANTRSALLTGLNEGTTYHYRISATNSLGTSFGSDQTFATLGQVGAPEYGRCVAQKEGEYTNSTCLAKDKKPKKGKFEWKPGPPPFCVAQKKGEYTESACKTKSAKPKKGTFETAPGPGYTSTIGTVTLATPALGATVTCAAGTATGEVTSAKAGAQRITFTGCERSGKKCTSEGPSSSASGIAGVIVTNLLGTRLFGPVEGNVWMQLASSEHEPYLAEFGCEGQRFRTKGSGTGVHAGDVGVPSTTSVTEFSSEEGEQVLFTEASEDGGKSWTGPDPSTVAMTLTNTSASSTEIKP
jgi:hypothetical protein